MIAVQVMWGNRKTYSRFMDRKQGIWKLWAVCRQCKPRQCGCANFFQLAKQPREILLRGGPSCD